MMSFIITDLKKTNQSAIHLIQYIVTELPVFFLLHAFKTAGTCTSKTSPCIITTLDL